MKIYSTYAYACIRIFLYIRFFEGEVILKTFWKAGEAMLNIYRTDDEKVNEINGYESDCWINLSEPTSQEISWVIEQTGVEADFLRAPLDEEERSRIETDNMQTLILVDTPFVETEDETEEYMTMPMGIVLMEDCTITVCLKEAPVLRDFYKGRVRGFSTKKRNRFILQVLYRNAARFLYYLRRIDKKSNDVEYELHKSMKNKELIAMMKLEKSLVYFSTSLKGNEAVLERLLRMSFIRQYPDDTDLLEDVIIENKQAIEMCTIYRDILSGTMDAFASVISNNLNIVMKVLTLITIIMTIPTIIASLWGMNVMVPFANNPYGFWIVVAMCALVSALVTFIMSRKKMF